VLSARDFEELLPWYLNGSLTERERILVADYLKAHPEGDARVQWNASLRARVKEEVEEVPQDIGLDRVLATMRRGSSEAHDARPTRHGWVMPAGLGAWVALLGGGRVAWAAALASVVLVAGTIVMFNAHMHERLRQSTASVAAVSQTPTPPPTDQPPQPAIAQAGETGKVGSTVAPASAPPMPGRLPTYRVTPRSQQPPQQPAPAEPDAWRLSPSIADLGKQGTSPNRSEGERSEPGPIAEAPAETMPAPKDGAAEVASSRLTKRGAASESPTIGLPTPGEQTKVADARPAAVVTAPETARRSLTQTDERETASSSTRVAMSGKSNTSCPSTNKQREDALRAANPDQLVRAQAEWIEYIKQLLKAGCRDAADQQWVEFHKKYPDEKAPPELETSK
jgi:hypothetical protein